MAKQIGVEWLKNMIEWNYGNPKMLEITWENLDDLIERAKAIEKENIIDAWDKRCTEGTFIGGWHIETKSGEEYYNEQYKTK